MNGKRGAVVLAIAVASLSVARANETTGDDEVAILRTQTQALLDAIAPGNRSVWQRYLHDELVHVDENGILRNKQQLIEEITPLPAGLNGRIVIDHFTARLHGSTAVAAYEVQEYLDYHGQPLRTRFRGVDTWLRTDAGWRLAGGHTAAVLTDPPTVRLTPRQLCDYEGVYRLTPSIEVSLRVAGGGLRAERQGRPAAIYTPELPDLFFTAGQPRTRRIFMRDSQGRVSGFADRREGEDIRWSLTRASFGATSDVCRAEGAREDRP